MFDGFGLAMKKAKVKHLEILKALKMKRTFTILVADKNRNVRDFLRRELSAVGYEVTVAEDGVGF